MRILLVNDYQEQVGGTEVYLATLAKKLETAGHTVSFYFGSDNYSQALKNQKSLGTYLKRIINPIHYFGLKKVIATFKPDVIHLQNIFNELSPVILLATGSVPVVMTLHDYSIVQAVATPSLRNGKQCRKQICPGCLNCVGLGGTIYEKLKRFIHHFLLPKIKLFIAPSRFMQRAVESNGPYQVVQIYNGFELPNQTTYQSEPTAIFAGRLIQDKGIDYLIQAIPQVVKKIPKFKLLIAGEGKLDTHLVSLVAELGIKDNITFLGRLSSKELLEYYHQAAIVIIPSIWHENLPTVGIEALSLGKPMIGTRVGGIPELIDEGENGLLVPPYDANALGDAIITILNSKSSLKTMSSKAAMKSKTFTIAHHVHQILAVYDSVLSD